MCARRCTTTLTRLRCPLVRHRLRCRRFWHSALRRLRPAAGPRRRPPAMAGANRSTRPTKPAGSQIGLGRKSLPRRLRFRLPHRRPGERGAVTGAGLWVGVPATYPGLAPRGHCPRNLPGAFPRLAVPDVAKRKVHINRIRGGWGKGCCPRLNSHSHHGDTHRALAYGGKASQAEKKFRVCSSIVGSLSRPRLPAG